MTLAWCPTPAMQLRFCYHFRHNPDNGIYMDLPKTRNTTRLKCCAYHAKWRWIRSKVLRLPRKCKSSSENLAKVLRLPHKTTFDIFADTWECHEVPRLPHKTTLEPVWKPLKMRGFAASPIDTATLQECPSMKTRQAGSSKRAFHPRFPDIFKLCSDKINVLLRVFLTNPKLVSREASVTFHHISQNATPATEFTRCHHLTQTRNTTRLKCCACHAKWRWRSPKCCACHEKCNSSSEQDAQILRLLHKTTLDTLWNMLECHKVPRLPRETRLRATRNEASGRLKPPKGDHFCRTHHRRNV